jgi:ferredoxin
VNKKGIHLEVDETLCTGCGLCEERAPENMEMVDDEPYARVIKQPSGESETAECTEAADYCPTGGLMAAELEANTEENAA